MQCSWISAEDLDTMVSQATRNHGVEPARFLRAAALPKPFLTGTMNNDTDVQRRLRWHRRINVGAFAVGLLMTGAWIGSRAPTPPDVLRVRGLIVEDSLGRPRIVIGAPLPVEGREALAGGEGIALRSPEGRFRVAIGAPTPGPIIEGRPVERIGGGSAGLLIFDDDGDERGGMGTFADGRANVCLDYENGVKEAVAIIRASDRRSRFGGGP